MGKKKDRLIQVRVPADLATQAKSQANEQDRPLAQVIRELLRAWLTKPAK